MTRKISHKAQKPDTNPDSIAPTAPALKTGNAVTPSRDEVAECAYFIYLNQGSQSGEDVCHWLQAEAELMKANGFVNG